MYPFYFHSLTERSKQLDLIRKKDPPMLSINEMKEMVNTVDKFMSMLEQDMILANVSITYQN